MLLYQLTNSVLFQSQTMEVQEEEELTVGVEDQLNPFYPSVTVWSRQTHYGILTGKFRL